MVSWWYVDDATYFPLVDEDSKAHNVPRFVQAVNDKGNFLNPESMLVVMTVFFLLFLY